MTDLEILAPAKNIEIGIAAIDCGADAVYIAGPAFGARQAAGNSMDDIKDLCAYAHKFGVRIYMTLNTILYDNELAEAYRLMCEAEDAGVDALIVQDLSVIKMANGGPDMTSRKIRIPIHASTQCAIRDSEKAIFYRNLGFSRLVLERELSLQDIKKIYNAVGCEIEFFVHGALCVCYSGQCYMSEKISKRSANRGECIQACRSLYNLTDASGKVIIRNKALLSLKDYRLIDRLEDLATAGVCSFKIEGRLKNISYVKNTVRAYSSALDKLIAKYPDKYRRSSFGQVSGSFVPNLDKTFNRGYTELYLDGKRKSWASMDTPKGMGEAIGKIRSVKTCGNDMMEICIDMNNRIILCNGDGYAFTGKDGEIIGFRGDICIGNTIRCKRVSGLKPQLPLYRNVSIAFEKELSSHICRRLINVNTDITLEGNTSDGFTIRLDAVSEDGRKVSVNASAGHEPANNQERMLSLITSQTNKASIDYIFQASGLDSEPFIKVHTSDGNIPFITSAALNSLRRSAAELLAHKDVNVRPLLNVRENNSKHVLEDNDNRRFPPNDIDYKFNVSNQIASQLYHEQGVEHISEAYELAHDAGAELMRTKYCIRYELGMCLKQTRTNSKIQHGPLFLENNGQKFALNFDCARCEMTVKEA